MLHKVSKDNRKDWSVKLDDAVRRHAFIVWMAIQDRLVTLDKLHKWGLTNSRSFVFCQVSDEDRDDLFFGFYFTTGIWMRILRLCGNSRMPRNWVNEFLGLLTPRVNPSTLLLRGLHGVLLSITYGDNEIVGFMRTSLFPLMLFFTSYVMMLDLEYMVFRRLLIILLTECGVRDGPSLTEPFPSDRNLPATPQ